MEKSQSKRGGARPGAGRPCGRSPRVRMSVDMTPEEHDTIKALAAGKGITPSRWIKLAVQAALHDDTLPE